MASLENHCELSTKINEWLNWNRNEEMREAVEHLLKEDDVQVLEDLFLKRMEFGTAGLRGRMGPGYSQMNDLVIIQTAQGLLKYSLMKCEQPMKTSGLVIGYDGRHNSKRFAELTAGIFLRGDCKVFMYSKIVPTPFVPFAVNKYGAAVGVMVTASHNPKEDNGYKVYWCNGAQIISPHDKGITRCIEESLEPIEGAWDLSILKQNNKLIDPLDEVMNDYYEIIDRNLYDKPSNMNSPFSITYTAMHGVGYPYIVHAFTTANFKEVIGVKEQIEPDPEFPTVRFPNPEEGKSALDLAIKTANANHSVIILANDPDADRLAVAEKMGDSWKIFTGNEIGALLGWWMIHSYKLKHPQMNFKDVYALSSTVSSKILQTIAKAEGLSFEETLTGFKWMGNRAYELIEDGKQVLFAFEEAIGFMCGSAVLDKDGISAAVCVAEMANFLYRQTQTLSTKLNAIYKIYGHHLCDNSYFICHKPEVMTKIFNRLRNYKTISKDYTLQSYPESVLNGKYKVISVRDLTVGFDSTKPNNKATLPTSSSSQMITFKFQNGFLLTLRTSGTEPKLKYYSELCADPNIQDITQLNSILKEMVNAAVDEFLQPTKNELITRAMKLLFFI